MIRTMGINFRDPDIKRHMMEGYFGLEKESLRVTSEGFLSHTKHPFRDNPHMERDFCENQMELITEVSRSADEVWEQLALLQKKAVKTLQDLKTGKEFLWPFSNPPYVRGEQDIPIANYRGGLRGKELYRKYLAEKYGKRKMLFSGIHFNFSFSERILEEGYRKSGYADWKEYRDAIYLELAKKVTKYSWLIVYLTAASPVMDGSFFREEDLGKDIHKNLASPRCSTIGYWNNFEPLLSYDTLQNYVESIQSYVERGQLKEVSELYYPVRLKPRGENTLDRLRQHGVDHIEFRMLDLNPLEPVGIRREDLKFLHLLILYLIAGEDIEFLPFEQSMALKNEKRAAKFEENNIRIETGWNRALPVRAAAFHVLASMEQFFVSLGQKELVEVIRFQERKVFCPNERYAEQIRRRFQKDYVKQGLELAKQHVKELIYYV